MSSRYHEVLDYPRGVSLWVDFRTVRGKVVDYTVVLLFETLEGIETIRVYDSTHGYNEMHRYTRADGKQTGTLFHSGTLSEGVQAAINNAKRGYLQMIEGWDDD